MKTNRSPRAKLACRIVRQWNALRPAACSRHLASCPDCQAWVQRAAALDGRLRRDAAESPPVMSATLEWRINQAVRMAGRAGRDDLPQRRARSLLFGGLLVAAAGVATILLVAPQRPSGGAGPVADGRANRDEAALVIGTVQDISNELVTSVLPATGEFVANNPLQREVDSLYADARSALGFLAMNFLPPRREPAPPRSG